MGKLGKLAQTAFKSGINQYIVVVIVIIATALACKLFTTQQSYYMVSFVLLFVVSILAVFLGIGPILLASSMSAIVWNYFFIPPHYVLHIERTEDKMVFFFFFFIALINGVLTNRIRRQERLAHEGEERTNAIFELTRELLNTNGTNEIINVAFKDAKRYFNVLSINFLVARGNNVEIAVRKGEENENSRIDINIAGWVYSNSMKAGRYTDFSGETGLTYYPLVGNRINPGVIAIEFEKPLSKENENFWLGYLSQISNALERELLSDLALKARILDESDKLYKTLFALISHEFRIPIATVMGASDTLLTQGTNESDREQLLKEIFKASSRLDHLVENLLNMTRLESGKISAHIDWCDVNDLFYKATETLKPELEQHNLIRDIDPEMPLVRLDFGLMEQVIKNLILNACRHTPFRSMIRFGAFYREGKLIMVVEDDGPGISQESLEKIFDKFYRVNSTKAGGLGLGLSIVKGLVEAHQGTVNVENIKGKGTRFTVKIPSEIPDINNIYPEQ